MPFYISGNLSSIDRLAIRKLEKNFRLILSEHQFPLEQYNLIHHSLQDNIQPDQILMNLSKSDMFSLIHLITQFGDYVNLQNSESLNFDNNPFVIEWKKDHFMIPLEFFEFFSTLKVFKDQDYLFSLIPLLPIREKKNWLEWIGRSLSPKNSTEINFELYYNCFQLQHNTNFKALIQEPHLPLESIWPLGKNEIIDWYYKEVANFYFCMQELSRIEKDPFIRYILDLVKSGRLILKKDRSKSRFKEELVFTVEGKVPQQKEKLGIWEINFQTNNLFFHQTDLFNEDIEAKEQNL